MIEGNIVATYKYPHCTVYISDSGYAGKSAAQMEQERADARRLAGQYYRKALVQEMERLRASGMLAIMKSLGISDLAKNARAGDDDEL